MFFGISCRCRYRYYVWLSADIHTVAVLTETKDTREYRIYCYYCYYCYSYDFLRVFPELHLLPNCYPTVTATRAWGVGSAGNGKLLLNSGFNRLNAQFNFICVLLFARNIRLAIARHAIRAIREGAGVPPFGDPGSRLGEGAIYVATPTFESRQKKLLLNHPFEPAFRRSRNC